MCHKSLNITFRLHEQRLNELVHSINNSDADESEEFVEEEDNVRNYQENVDFVIQGQNYFALRKYGNEYNDIGSVDQIDHSSSPYNSLNLVDGVIECNYVNEVALEIQK